MKDSIIEKLGITPGPWVLPKNVWGTVYAGAEEYGMIATGVSGPNNAGNMQLIAAAPEMLDELIKWCSAYEDEYDCVDENTVVIIQKATGKSWEEIQELIDED